MVQSRARRQPPHSKFDDSSLIAHACTGLSRECGRLVIVLGAQEGPGADSLARGTPRRSTARAQVRYALYNKCRALICRY